MFSTAPAFAEQTQSETALRAAAVESTALPGSAALLAACPADIYASRRNTLRDLLQTKQLQSWTYCADHAEACAQACRDDFDGKACVAIATAIEVAGKPDLELSARRYHAFACALGAPGGCTNRGGGMRNAPIAFDPWWPDTPIAADEEAKQSCLYRSFRAACTDGDSWGCAMLGQALALGEGTRPDAAAARLRYTQACELTQDKSFASCVFAREGLDQLSRPTKP